MTVRKAAFWAMADQYIGFAIQFAASLILARWFISPAQLGVFSIAFAAVSLIAFLQDFGVGRYINGETELDDAKLRAAYSFSLTLGWIIAMLCVALAWPLANFYDDTALVPVTLVIAASYFFFPFSIVPQAMRQREMDFRSTAMIGISAALANAATAITLGWMGHGALALAWGALAQQLARMIMAQWRAGGLNPWPFHYANVRTLMDFAGTNTVLVTCLLVVSRAPELMIGRVLGAAPVGLFARATGLAMQLRMLLSGAVSSVFFPAFARVRDRGEPLGPPYMRVVAAYTAITWPAMAGLAVLAQPTVHLLYGPVWIASAPLLAWIALSQMCFITFPLNADMPILLGHRHELILRNVIDVLLAIGLLIAAMPHGIEAVAMSRLVHGLLWMANFGPFLRRIVGFSWYAIGKVMAQSALATMAAVGPAILMYETWHGPATAGFAQILTSAGLGIGLWVIVLRQIRHPAYEEIAHIMSAVLGRARLAHLVPPPRPASH